jgi:hypothetical protein
MKLRIMLATAMLGGLPLVGVAAFATTASASTYLGGVDMQRACSTQQPAMGLAAVVTNQRNAYSWQCKAPWGYAVGIDVNRECVTQYGSGAFAGLGSSTNPYSWYCQR